jgi:hypothetical protein
MVKNKIRFTVSIDPEVDKEISYLQYSAKKSTAKSEIVRDLINRGLRQMKSNEKRRANKK